MTIAGVILIEILDIGQQGFRRHRVIFSAGVCIKGMQEAMVGGNKYHRIIISIINNHGLRVDRVTHLQTGFGDIAITIIVFDVYASRPFKQYLTQPLRIGFTIGVHGSSSNCTVIFMHLISTRYDATRAIKEVDISG